VPVIAGQRPSTDDGGRRRDDGVGAGAAGCDERLEICRTVPAVLPMVPTIRIITAAGGNAPETVVTYKEVSMDSRHQTQKEKGPTLLVRQPLEKD
jgi:hypothetical protein